MSFHAGQTFTFGEQPSATKWQYLWDNDYALADGTGISNDAIITRHILDGQVTAAKIANRTRRAMFSIQGDGGTATNSKIEGTPEVSFAGTVADYGRGHVCVPQDYVSGTTAQIVLHVRTTNSQSRTGTHFIGARGPSGAWSSWNVVTAGANPSFAFTTDMKEQTLATTIPAANLAAGGTVVFAYGNFGAITGTIFLVAAELIYTADS
jgi:hypothetical protein